MPFWNHHLIDDPMATLILGRGVKTSNHGGKMPLCPSRQILFYRVIRWIRTQEQGLMIVLKAPVTPRLGANFLLVRNAL